MLSIRKETGSLTDGSMGTKLKQRQSQSEWQCWTSGCWTWPQAQTLAPRCEPQLDDIGILLPIRRNSPPILSFTFPVSFAFVSYSTFYLFYDASGWLMDHRISEFITSTGLLDIDTANPVLSPSYPFCFPPLGLDIKHTTVSYFYSLWFLPLLLLSSP